MNKHQQEANNLHSSSGSNQLSAIALIDGEHYLPVTKSALQKIATNYDLKAAVFIGGTEKITDDSELLDLQIPVIKEEQAESSLQDALDEFKPQIVIDLSDEPVLDYKKRFKLASITLKNNIKYAGADFIFNPPHLEEVLNKPSISIIGTGKRVGKTAVSAYVSRLIKETNNPVIIAMGRGGPSEPEVLKGDEINLTPESLLEQSLAGKHAASDYYEDALVSRVTTIGCRRAGGGLAGEPFISNVLEGAKIANELENDFVILEGSGSAIPPVKADKNILIIGAYQRLEDIAGYFGPFRVLIADMIILTMCEEPLVSSQQLDRVVNVIKEIKPNVEIIKTIFRPKPLEDISGKKIFVATTAKTGLENIKNHLEKDFNCEVVCIDNNLSNRPLLRNAISDCKDFDILLTELKAAAVDVATSLAIELGKKVVYMDNNPVALDSIELDKSLNNFVNSILQK